MCRYVYICNFLKCIYKEYIFIIIYIYGGYYYSFYNCLCRLSKKRKKSKKTPKKYCIYNWHIYTFVHTMYIYTHIYNTDMYLCVSLQSSYTYICPYHHDVRKRFFFEPTQCIQKGIRAKLTTPRPVSASLFPVFPPPQSNLYLPRFPQRYTYAGAVQEPSGEHVLSFTRSI